MSLYRGTKLYSLKNLQESLQIMESNDDEIIAKEFLKVEKINELIKSLEKNFKEIDNNYSLQFYLLKNYNEKFVFEIKLNYLDEELTQFTTNNDIKFQNNSYSIYKSNITLEMMRMSSSYQESKGKVIDFLKDENEWIKGMEDILISRFLNHHKIKRRVDELNKKFNNCNNSNKLKM